MRVSVVGTVLNEADNLPYLLDSLAAQTRMPDEVILCDGGSTDGTLEILSNERRLPLRLIHRPGYNISQGRNAAIKAATGEIIAVTDAGVRLAPHWLERIVAPFEQEEEQEERETTWAVAGFFLPDPQTVFEVAMGATVLPELREIESSRFLPSSRSVAFRKEVWQAVGGYPEWLDYCEDLIFDFRIRDRFGPFVFAPDAVVYFRPRPTLWAFFTQYYRYARGDGKADLWRKRHAIRYLAYGIAMPLIALAGLWVHPAWWAFYLPAVPALFGAGWRRLIHQWASLAWRERWLALLWVPVIRITGDVAKMIGYPAGVWWRWGHRDQIPNWR